MTTLERETDVLIVGGGNAGLCAAICAREAGARVLILESAPVALRGGNSRHTRNLRYCHDDATEVLTGAYPEEEYFEDLLRVNRGATNERLARFAIRESKDLGRWMQNHGCRFQPPLRGTLHLSRTNAFFLGGGKALVNALYDNAERLGVEVCYESAVGSLEFERGEFRGATISGDGSCVRARSLVVASGGFEANVAWLKESWGEAAENFVVRGTPHNTGVPLRELLRKGALAVGNPRNFHAVALDGRSPKTDGGIVTRLDCVPFGIAVNKHARRFYDEGEDFWPKRYAIWGGLIAQQDDQVAFSIFDSKSIGLFMPPVFPTIQAPTLRELATELGLDPDRLEATVEEFNCAVRPGEFDPGKLDGCRTEGIDPGKSNWARFIDTSPYCAHPLRPGITFTYHGLAVDAEARVLLEKGGRAENVWAAGEVMAGNILTCGYLAGAGMTIGSVFGRIAGREAARHALDGNA